MKKTTSQPAQEVEVLNVNSPEFIAAQDNVTQEIVNTEPQQTYEVANPVNAESGMLIGNSQDLFKTNLMAMWTSIDPAKKALILRASGDSDFSMMEWFDKHPAEAINVVDVLVHNVQLASEETNEDGEVLYTTQPRTVLIDAAGNTYSSVSQGVLGSLQKIIALYGPPSWPEGLKITARRVKTRRFTTINLLVQE